eukprot:scaffold29260_cov49-Attheya_sp.AAC.2
MAGCHEYDVREPLAIQSRATRQLTTCFACQNTRCKLTSKNELITLSFHAKVSLFLREKIQIGCSTTAVDLLPKTTMATLDNDHPSRLNLYPFLVISIHIADPE